MKKRENESREALWRLRGLESRHGVFIPDCICHVLTSSDKHINEIKVNGLSFNESLGQWLEGEVAVFVESDCGDEIGCNPNCPGRKSREFLRD